MLEMEQRSVAEYRTDGNTLSGYVATFGNKARIGSFTESIRAGAFNQSLSSGRDILALADHDSCRILGRTKSGSLKLCEDSHGLRFELRVPNTSAGRDVMELARLGDLGGCSFGFVERDSHWNGDDRELIDVDLREISIVSAWPAYEGTTVLARNALPKKARAQRYLQTILDEGPLVIPQ